MVDAALQTVLHARTARLANVYSLSIIVFGCLGKIVTAPGAPVARCCF